MEGRRKGGDSAPGDVRIRWRHASVEVPKESGSYAVLHGDKPDRIRIVQFNAAQGWWFEWDGPFRRRLMEPTFWGRIEFAEPEGEEGR